ncbi:hypothetical protein MMC30_003833 [Trapelia coarctata]|nr:hypothetical protein [Trapelia coarctata]
MGMVLGLEDDRRCRRGGFVFEEDTNPRPGLWTLDTRYWTGLELTWILDSTLGGWVGSGSGSSRLDLDLDLPELDSLPGAGSPSLELDLRNRSWISWSCASRSWTSGTGAGSSGTGLLEAGSPAPELGLLTGARLPIRSWPSRSWTPPLLALDLELDLPNWNWDTGPGLAFPLDLSLDSPRKELASLPIYRSLSPRGPDHPSLVPFAA